ncbi:hypothetical protein GUJ93_ZPchr0001g30203 [Zizania palustris]|uniref:Uncharacterized protein n=1 Tax=Zizania palustris TaxID=103762 RepID=A0A8J5VPF4_ZIZPA|nr:hypothetical protein GUJ93_ZPchr0001g30203 [Zizania palustris]
MRAREPLRLVAGRVKVVEQLLVVDGDVERPARAAVNDVGHLGEVEDGNPLHIWFRSQGCCQLSTVEALRRMADGTEKKKSSQLLAGGDDIALFLLVRLTQG